MIPILHSLRQCTEHLRMVFTSDNLAILFKQILLPEFPTEELLYPFADCSGHIADLH